MQASVANPAEAVHLGELWKIVEQECAHLQAEFQKTYGPPNAVASGVATGTTLLSDHATQSAAQVLPTDRTGQMLNGQHGVVVPNLDPSAANFQPNDGNLPGSAVATDLAGVQVPFGTGSMTTQEYEATLDDPHYIGDRQWEHEELLQMIE